MSSATVILRCGLKIKKIIIIKSILLEHTIRVIVREGGRGSIVVRICEKGRFKPGVKE